MIRLPQLELSAGALMSLGRVVAGMQTELVTGVMAAPSTPPLPDAYVITAPLDAYVITASSYYEAPYSDAGAPVIGKHSAGHQPSPHHQRRKLAARKRQRKARK